MFVEYPFSIDDKKAEIRLNTVVHNLKSDKAMIYIERSESDYMAVVKMKSGRRVYEKQRWLIKRTQKGLDVKRVWSKAYLVDILCITLFILAFLAAVVLSIINPAIRLEMILVGMVFGLALIFYIWKRVATPRISLNIFLLKIL